MARPGAAGKRCLPVSRPAREEITAAVFAGGAGRRIGGDKPLRHLGGRPLIAHVLAALAPQAARVLVVARGEEEAARLVAHATPFLAHARDVLPAADRAGLEGPVAALLGAADRAATPFLLTAPVDTPFLPQDLASRLSAGLGRGDAAMAADGRIHPTILLARPAAVRVLSPARSLSATLAPLAPVSVSFAAEELANVNTAEDLAAAQARLAAR